MKKYFWPIMISAAIILFLVLFFIVLIFGVRHKQWDGPFVRKAASFAGLSAAKVGKRDVPYTEYLAHLDAERQFLSGPAARAQGFPSALTPELRAQALDRAMRIATIEEFAEKRHVIITALDVDRAYESLLRKAASSTTPEQVRSFLKDEFGWSEEDFKHYVVRPSITEDALRAKKLLENKDPEAFEQELQDRLKQSDVVRYLKF